MDERSEELHRLRTEILHLEEERDQMRAGLIGHKDRIALLLRKLRRIKEILDE